jgi:hypothetical protein
VGVDAAGVDVGLPPPDTLEEPLAGQHAPGPLDHVAEEIELLVGETDLLAPVAKLAATAEKAGSLNGFLEPTGPPC